MTEEKKLGGMKMSKKVIIGVVIVIAALMLAVGSFAMSKLSKVKKTKLEKKDLGVSEEMAEQNKGYLNVALFGIDAHSDKDKKVQSDAIVIASLNKETKEVKLISVYGNALLTEKDGRLTAAKNIYNGGIESAIETLNRNLDLDIAHYVSVDFKGLIEVIDYLGGIEIDVKKEEIPHITGYTADLIKVTGKDSMGITKAGPQVLNGTQATAYCRIRATKGADMVRTGRQKEVLMKVLEKLMALDAGKLNEAVDKVLPNIETNFKTSEIIDYAKDLKAYQMGDMTGFPMTISDKKGKGGKDAILSGDYKGDVIKLHQQFFPDLSYEVSEQVKKTADKLEK